MMHGHPAALLLAVLKQREVHHPQEVELVGVDQAVLAADFQTNLAQRGAGLDPVSIADDQQHVAGFQLHRLVQGCLFLFGQELFKAGRSTFLGQAAECQTLSAISLGNLAQFVNVLAGQLASQALGIDGADAAALLQHCGKGLKLGAIKNVGHIHNFQAKAGIRFIGAKTAHSLVPRHTHERGLHIHAQHFFPQALDQTFVDGHDIVLIDKGHFLVHLGELRLAVSAQVLIAVAAGDLEVAVKAGQHQNLLVQLRALRQGVEMAGLHTAGHQIVTGTFRRGLDQGRGFNFGKVVIAEIAADDLHDLAAQHNGLVHRRTAQIQVAVTQAQVIVDVDIIADFERRGLGFTQNAQFADIQLHIASGDLGGLGGALTQQAAADHNILAFQAFCFSKNVFRRILIKNKLQNTGCIAQVGKNNTAFVACTGDGTANGHLLANV